MSPARRRRASAARLFSLTNARAIGAFLLIVGGPIANYYHSEQVRGTAVHADTQTQALAAVAVSGAELSDALSQRVSTMEVRMAAMERELRRRRAPVTYVDTIRYSPIALGPQEQSHGLLWHMLNPFSGGKR